MAAAGYTTDLTLLNACDGTGVGTWSEPTGFTVGNAPAAEGDFYIQLTSGTSGCVSKNMPSTGLAGIGVLNGSTFTVPTDGAVIQWMIFAAPNSLATQAAGGMQMFIGSSSANFRQYYVRGSDTYTYGGWVCVPVNPAVAADATTGTGGASPWQYNGMGVNCPTTAPSKGQPQGIDCIRYGRCEMRINGGDLANGYATFAGFATQNDSLVNRWGLLQAVAGGYNFQGLMVLGYTSAVDFRDSNTNIFIQNTQKVTAAFNAVEIRQATSNVIMTNVSFLALGTVSRGNWITTDDATVALTACTFTDMGTFGFKSKTTATSCVFRRTDQITQSSATLTNCTIDNNRAASNILSNNPSLITGCNFISDGTGHGIEITTAGSYNFTGNIFTGYDTANPGTDANGAALNGTTNAMVYNNSGGRVDINLVSGTNITVRNGAGATTYVTAGNKTVTLTGLKNPSEVRVFNQGTTTERAGTGAENVTTGTHSFTLPAGTAVDISILSLGYQNMRILNFSTSTDTTIPISQVLDRQYLNP